MDRDFKVSLFQGLRNSKVMIISIFVFICLYSLVYGKQILQVKADKLLEWDRDSVWIKVLYELPALSGESIFLKVDYNHNIDDKTKLEIRNVSLELAESKKVTGEYSYYLRTKENQEIKVTFSYQEDELTNRHIHLTPVTTICRIIGYGRIPENYA